MLDDLVQTIETLKQRIKDHRDHIQNYESRTRVTLIDPLLRALGWDVSDPSIVRIEHNVDAGRPDYALLGMNTQPVLFVEAKKLAENASPVAQIVSYVVTENIQNKTNVGITPPAPDDPILPESKLADRILDEQDELVEDVLVATSVNVRILSEIFPNKLKKHKVSVYDYDDGEVGKIELSKIADLLLHNRYLVIKGHQVVDLLSDKKSMADDLQMGLKIDFLEYVSEVEKVVSGLTVKDLIDKLWGMTKVLSTSSSVKDIVFLTQNLYTLGDSVVGDPVPIAGGPLKTILDRVAGNYIDRMFPNDSAPRGKTIPFPVVFRTPRFYLESDVDLKQIRTEVEVNGGPETLVMDYEEFFREVSKASGNAGLYRKPSR